MNSYSIKDIIETNDRFKIFKLVYNSGELNECFDFIKLYGIKSLNIGNELSNYINKVDDYRFLNIDVYDFTKKLLEKNKCKINGVGNDVLALYNLGILLEPRLELNAIQLLKEFSKSASLIILWENQGDIADRLTWPTQKSDVFLDFTETQLKNLQYEI